MTGEMAVVGPHTARRAETIYLQARGGIDSRLWRAALGYTGEAGSVATGHAKGGLALATLVEAAVASTPTPAPASRTARVVSRPPTSSGDGRIKPSTIPAGYRQYAGNIKAAAERTGIPAAALAAIVDAEAAKDKAGQWRTDSRNARSTATGLGQFLAGTWRSEAERAGTWLNEAAKARGWLGSDGKVLPQARALLLELRNDADASINATADYARRSLDSLGKAGIAVGDTIEKIAEAAYIGHNLGTGDAVRFFKGGLGERRARVLLDAQVGIGKSSARIARAGTAGAAHRGWLLDFVARNVRSGRFLD